MSRSASDYVPLEERSKARLRLLLRKLEAIHEKRRGEETYGEVHVRLVYKKGLIHTVRITEEQIIQDAPPEEE